VSGQTIKPNPRAAARDAVIGRVRSAYRTSRGAVVLELEPEPVKVIDFYPQPQRKRDGLLRS